MNIETRELILYAEKLEQELAALRERQDDFIEDIADKVRENAALRAERDEMHRRLIEGTHKGARGIPATRGAESESTEKDRTIARLKAPVSEPEKRKYSLTQTGRYPLWADVDALIAARAEGKS